MPDDPTTLGSVLKSLRLRRHLTQEQLAKRLNTTKANISKIEDSVHDPSLALFRAYTEHFNVSADALLDYKLRGDAYANKSS